MKHQKRQHLGFCGFIVPSSMHAEHFPKTSVAMLTCRLFGRITRKGANKKWSGRKNLTNSFKDIFSKEASQEVF
jgi:hypothetical protein